MADRWDDDEGDDYVPPRAPPRRDDSDSDTEHDLPPFVRQLVERRRTLETQSVRAALSFTTDPFGTVTDAVVPPAQRRLAANMRASLEKLIGSGPRVVGTSASVRKRHAGRSPVYTEFEHMVAEPVRERLRRDVPHGVCDVEAEFELFGYVMTNREWDNRSRAGPLALIFLHYATLPAAEARAAGEAPLPRRGQPSLSLADAKDPSSFMGFPEFAYFCKDFGLLPQRVSRSEAALIYRLSARRPAAVAQAATAAASVRRPHSAMVRGQKGAPAPAPLDGGLGFDEFVAALTRTALLVFAKPQFRQAELRSPRQIVAAFAQWLGLRSMSTVRARLAQLRGLQDFRERQQLLTAEAPGITVGASLGLAASEQVYATFQRSAIAEPLPEAVGPNGELLRHVSGDDMRPLARFACDAPPEKWVKFLGPFLDLGVVPLGPEMARKYRYRIVLRNRHSGCVCMRVSCRETPWLTAEYRSARAAAAMASGRLSAHFALLAQRQGTAAGAGHDAGGQAAAAGPGPHVPRRGRRAGESHAARRVGVAARRREARRVPGRHRHHGGGVRRGQPHAARGRAG
jgi:hypothetical protein